MIHLPLRLLLLIVCFCSFLLITNGCKKAGKGVLLKIDTTDLNKNSGNPYVKYKLPRMNRTRLWTRCCYSDTSFPISFLNDTVIYVLSKPMLLLSGYTTDSTITFGIGPSIYVRDNLYLEYLFNSDKITIYTMNYRSYPYYRWESTKEYTSVK